MKIRHTISLFYFGLFAAFSAPSLAQPFTEVAVGLSHLCGLSIDGSVDCRTQTHSRRYDSPDDLPALKAISAGHQHTCGITLDGAAVCWGGLNFYQEQTIPQIDQPLVDIFAGTSHTCAIDVNNRAWCWGLDTNEQTQVPNNGLGDDGTGFLTLSANGNATCGIQLSGNLNCWSTDSRISDTSSLAGNFIDLDVSGLTGCGLQDTGDIQCWRVGYLPTETMAPPTNGPYTDLVVSNAAICGLNQDQQLDCSFRFDGSVDESRYMSDTRFTSLESGKLFYLSNSNFCGVTVDGAIECIAAESLPVVPGGNAEAVGNEAITSSKLALTARAYDRNAVELFWPPIRQIPNSLVEIYLDDVLIETTDANFSYFDTSVKPESPVAYKIRLVDTNGNVGQFSNTVIIDLDTGVSTDDNLIVAGSLTEGVHTVSNVRVASLATEIIISWEGSETGSNGLQGYEIRVNNEPVATTRALSYTSSTFSNGGCNFVSVGAVSDDNTILDYETVTFFRTRNSFGSRC